MVDKPKLFSPRPGERGLTPLHYAAYCGDLDAVQTCLAESLEDLNKSDEVYGYTPLHWVVDMGCTGGRRSEIVIVLLEAGADIHAKDNQGRTPLTVAEDSTAHTLIELLKQRGA